MAKRSKHYCQKCGNEIPRMEKNARIFDSSNVVISQNVVVDRSSVRGGKTFYVASTKRVASYTICNKCVKSVVEELNRIISKPKMIVAETDIEGGDE